MAVTNSFNPKGKIVPSGKIVAKVYFQTAGDAMWFHAQGALLKMIDHYQRQLAAGAQVKLFFVGRADKRRYSAKGGNQKLSEKRAKVAKDFVDEKFKKPAFRRYRSEMSGTGARFAGRHLEEDRRVDVYEWYLPPPPVDTTPFQPKPPPAIARGKTVIDPYLGLIRRNHRKTIRGAASVAKGVLAWDSDKISWYASHGIRPRKPQWWDQRMNQIKGYKSGTDLVKKALLMHFDLQAYFYWENKAGYVGWAKSAYKNREAELRVRWFGAYEMHAFWSVSDLASEIIKATK